MNPFFQIQVQHTVSSSFSIDVDISSESRSVALYGPSGCGKTTLLRIIAGLVRVATANIQIGGRSFQNESQWLSPAERNIGLVMQDGLLFPLLNVRENLLFGVDRAVGRITIEEVSSMLEIDHLLDRRVRNLSGGERQRVALGMALLSEPDVLLCDEPFSALDRDRRARMVGMLNGVQERWDLPLVLVSHQRSDIDALVDSVYELNHGRVVITSSDVDDEERK
ncbi:MAG: ATP-binding cassette domain-containing protein [Myxococcota bacterium]